VIDGLRLLARRLGLDLAALLAATDHIVHGTTVATNALLEGKTARVGMLVTHGHRDVIEMREGLKPDRYDLRLPPPRDQVPRRLRLPVPGIALPGHFLVRYQSSRAELYVDAFHGGRLLTKADCVKHVVQLRQRFEESCLAPVSPRRILLRICANLHQIYTQQKAPVQAERLQRYLVALAK